MGEVKREFVQKLGYFILHEYHPDRDYSAKTHIIIQRCGGTNQYGMEIKRFNKHSGEPDYELAQNPYAGVYLTQEEWDTVHNAIACL
jgi:hypothetical protein